MKFDCYVAGVKVLTKKTFTSSKGNTCFQLGVESNDNIGTVGCTQEVFDYVFKDKTYDFGFAVNTDYDKIYIKFNSVYEASKPSK